MRLECPYCWQHYEIEPQDKSQEFTCICCGQVFNGRDAVILPPIKLRREKIVVYAALLLTVLLTLLNLYLFLRNLSSERNDECKIKISALNGQMEQLRSDLKQHMKSKQE